MNITSLSRLLVALACLAIGIPALAQATENPCVNENGKVLHVGNGVTPPTVIFKKDPAAEKKSSEEGKKTVDGMTVVQTIVGSDGQVCDAKIVRSAGKELDEKALEAVKQWKFKPAEKKGKPIAVALNIEINFHLYK